jgi:polyisoprenoid-binding protein YceI
MKKFLFIGLIFAAFCAAAIPFFNASAGVETFEDSIRNGATVLDTGSSGAYSFDKAHTFIGFRVKHMGLIEVPGYFRDFTGTVTYDAADVSKSVVEFTAKIASVDTGAKGRNDHLQKPEFFDSEKFPEMKFKSTKIAKKGKDGRWIIISGELTIRDVTKPITFPAEILGFIVSERGTRMGISAETTINRREFGVTYDVKLPNGTPSVADMITVTLQIEANMPAPAKTQ